jgi:transposase
MPEEFFALVSHHLPPEPVIGPKGGRPPIAHQTVLKVIWYILASGCRWDDVPLEMGCSGRTAHRRLRLWERLGVWDRLHADLLGLLRQNGCLDPGVAVVDSVYIRAFGGGEKTGPSPVDRRKKGTKYTLMVDRHGVPLGIRIAGAQVSDHRQLLPVVTNFPRVGGKAGRPKEHPEALYADRGFDSEPARGILKWLGIDPHIAKRGTQHGSGLGKVRWVVERTISWLKGLRRLRIRYDRLAVIQEAWTTLAASVICFHLLHEDLPAAA